ncbi:hypothetical protein [Chitinophaga sp. Cy-1792]|uniref:hypothetical protein n=1 Tax=Chitinophaga sp. Cy-1792 TaxID=2608339 RepID=UPI0014235299|nr:hypothetical protein [Chitinophaga sp. Cy-1792]NIG55444.1 hypothetical protein [Chitinophaga sp. Cy-1792]
MGWWTQITIIAEHLEDAPAIAKYIYEEDGKKWEKSGYTRVCYQEEPGGAGQRLFYTYERRNCIPDWIIAELSTQNPTAYFTGMADSPAWLCSPGGLMRYQAGKMLDNYLFDRKRTKLITPLNETDQPNDLFNPDFLYNWFGHGKPEAQLTTVPPHLALKDLKLFEGSWEFDAEEMEILDSFIAEWDLGAFRSAWTDITF